jgi:hypothetical protein
MSVFRFQYGLHLAIKGEEYVVAELLEDGFCTLRKVTTAMTITYSCSDLCVMYGDGDLVGLHDQGGRYPLSAAMKERLTRDLSTFREDLVNAAKQMLMYVKAVDSRQVRLDAEHVTAMIAEVSAQNDDASPPGWSRVYRCHRLWSASRKDIGALIPAYCNRGRHPLSSIPFVGATMMMVIGKLYMLPHYSSISDIHLEIMRQIEQQNKSRGPGLNCQSRARAP